MGFEQRIARGSKPVACIGLCLRFSAIPPDERRPPMAPQIRLACLYCDTSECDGVAAIPPDWADVQQVQSFAAACEEVAADDQARSPFDWFTHLGVCPECQKTND